jgi:hypothetical protein
VLGISHIDYVTRTVTIRFTDIILESCSGSIPVEKEVIRLSWNRSGNVIRYSVAVPEGFTVKIDNRSGYRVELADNGQEIGVK